MDPHAVTITLCAATAAGAILFALADKLQVPSIALLLLGGVLLGPQVLGIVDPASLGKGLEVVVVLAVAVILFEGGLTLDVAGFRQEPVVILRMLTIGVLVTWAAAAAAAYAFAGVEMTIAIVAGSLVIVTGPTVVSPLLRRIHIAPRLRHVLYWEAVLVDAVGVFVAVLCFEWLESSSDVPIAPVGRFMLRFAVGAGIGLAFGFGLTYALKKRWVESDHANIVVLGGALLAMGVANTILHESGILAVVTAGLVLSLFRPPELERLRKFKLELTELGIGLLFVLLAAKLELAQFLARGDSLILILVVVLFVARPLNVLVSTWGQRFTWREKTFISWLAPRGIVAASMASLFALRLADAGYEHAKFLETMTYAVIGTTVLAQGLSAPLVARVLGLRRPKLGTWLLIGPPKVAVALHRKLRQAGARTLVIATGDVQDSDGREEVDQLIADPLAPAAIRDPRVGEAEAIVALTGDRELDSKICAAWAPIVGAPSCYRWSDGDGEGVPLGDDLPQPGELAAGLDSGALALNTLELGPSEDFERFGGALSPLLAVGDGRIHVIGDDPPRALESVITLRRRVPGLDGLIRDAVIIDQPALDFESVVRSLLELAARDHPELAVDDKLVDILEREKTMPTAIGGGVAVPHVYDEAITRSSAYVGSIPGGLSLATPDDRAVRLVFLVISPAGSAQAHLMGLGAIARLASDQALLRVLGRQRTHARLLSLVRERE